ncbi:hypothetical protein QN277_009385 [Acacia crassicarpa]|uniref:Endonuclease/exonuclease/phosphatase domain-containing protein n=1 Tax=Acacia crassicarpa TaxID=499986 RepID=A0AAE1M5E8_9FABA|nr:hypothetical protein QN277_009385 [Acacia crassicarpa]
MNTLAWNCQGLGAALTVRNLKEVCFRKKPQLVFLMESKQKARVMRKIRRRCGFDQEWLVDPIGYSGGLALWLSDLLKVNILFSSSNIIHTSVTSSEFDTPNYISFIYGPTDEAERNLCWQELRRIGKTVVGSWLCLGDYNDILSQEEKYRGNPRPWRRIRNFRCLLADCDLFDLGFHGYKFTWCNNRDEPDTIKERLDRALGNLLLKETFPNIQVFNIEPEGSDHHLLLIQNSLERPRGKKTFRVEASWVLHDRFNQVVRDSWRGSVVEDLDAVANVLSKLERCKKEHIRWSHKEFPNSAKLIDQLKLKLADLSQDVRTSDTSIAIAEVKAAIDKFYELEEQFWWQRSRVN